MATPAGHRRRRGDGLYVTRHGSGPVTVLVHGVVGSHLVWDPLVPLLESHFTVARLDLPGYGNSPPLRVPATPDALVGAIRSALDATGLRPPYHLVGLSMGANLVLAYTAAHGDEVECLTGIGFPYYADPTTARAGLRRNSWTCLPATAPRLASVALPVAWWALRRSGLARRQRGGYTPEMADDALRVDYRSFASTLDSCMIHFPYDAMLAATTPVPRLFLHGSLDRWSPAGAVAGAVTRSRRTRFVRIEGAPHNLVVTRPEETATAIRRHWEARGRR